MTGLEDGKVDGLELSVTVGSELGGRDMVGSPVGANVAPSAAAGDPSVVLRENDIAGVISWSRLPRMSPVEAVCVLVIPS